MGKNNLFCEMNTSPNKTAHNIRPANIWQAVVASEKFKSQA
jgi:hypothetical protein